MNRRDHNRKRFLELFPEIATEYMSPDNQLVLHRLLGLGTPEQLGRYLRNQKLMKIWQAVSDDKRSKGAQPFSIARRVASQAVTDGVMAYELNARSMVDIFDSWDFDDDG